MDNKIIDFISQYISLTEEEANIIINQNLFKEYKKNELLLSAGEYANYCYFVVKGCVRAYHIIDGEERNTDFFFENQTIRPISYQSKKKSDSYLACLEDTILALGSDERNNVLLNQIPKLASLISQLNNDLLLEKTIEFDNFKNHSPEERYLLLMQNKPELLNRIPLYHLATYLGITQISLSRIRSRINQK